MKRIPVFPANVRMKSLFLSFIAMVFLPMWIEAAQEEPPRQHFVYLPGLVHEGNFFAPTPMVEFRGLWLTRFDWTRFGVPAKPAKIDEIVENASFGGFNVIMFQVRGTADAYYPSDLEPWAQRISGKALGQPPQPPWDPLQHLVEKAHAAAIQVHAYLNIYPVAEGGLYCDVIPDPAIEPTPLYQQLLNHHGATDDKPNGLQWKTNGDVFCHEYRRASPASPYVEDHVVAVASDLVQRYDIDGIHLDRIQYGAPNTSCDPVSLCRYNGLEDGCDPVPACIIDRPYKNWQRQRIDELVARLYSEVVRQKDGVWLTAAVTPVHINRPELNLPGYPLEGYRDQYQDSKGWLDNASIDGIMPMLYPGVYNCPDDSYWTQSIWQVLAEDFLADSSDRAIIPGIGGGYCTFDEINERISAGRAMGTTGHAIYSYRSLKDNGYFRDLRAGPHAIPATVPPFRWRQGE